MNKWKEFFEKMSQAPDGQLCKTQADKFKVLAEKDFVKSSEIKEILDDCAYYALASDFSMLAMNAVWENMKKEEAECNE